jgi:hypothetical protein
MGIDVRLEGEDGRVLAEVGDGRMVLARASQGSLTGTRLLRYLMPLWGHRLQSGSGSGSAGRHSPGHA